MDSITAVIVVKNNPPHLFESISSINDFVSEIIIGDIDIGNTFRKKLAENKKIVIYKLDSNVPYADLVKEDFKKYAKSKYILYLDPDELFAIGAKKFLKSNLGKYDYFYFPRKNVIFGKWIQHSRWWPDHQLRLFKKDHVVWPKEIHPVPKPSGKGYTFPDEAEYALLHYNYDNIDQYIEKASRYAKSEASSYIQKKQSYTLALSMQKALSEFISRFFGSEGYKDGMHGFTLAILQMFYYFLVYFYFWEKKKYANLEKNIPQYFQSYIQTLHLETNFWMNKKNLISMPTKLKLKVQDILLKLTS